MKDEASVTASAAIHVLVAACDAHTTPSDPVSPHVKPHTSPSMTSQPSRGVNASRDRMKQEMYRLRDTVEELQRQLAEIKRDHVKRSPRPLDPPTPSAAQLVAAWEAMARGQCEQRYRAEVENVKLRKLLDEQLKIAQTLERVLTKRRSSTSNEYQLGLGSACKRMRSSGSSPIDHPLALAEMDAMLPSLYAQVDAVLAKDCFTRSPGPFRSVDTRQTDAADATGGLTFVEATEKRLIPFTHDAVGEALWEYLVFYPDTSSSSDVAKYRDDLEAHALARDVDMVLQLPRFTGPIRLKLAARRYREHDRVVIVWVALVDPSEISEPALEGAHVRHTGWMCTRPASVDDPTSPSRMAEYISAQLSVPEFFDRQGERKRRGATITSFIVSAIQSQFDTSKQAVDNRLLERSRTGVRERGRENGTTVL